MKMNFKKIYFKIYLVSIFSILSIQISDQKNILLKLVLSILLVSTGVYLFEGFDESKKS